MKPKLVLTRNTGDFDASNEYSGWYRDYNRNDYWWLILNGKAYEYRVQYQTEPSK